MGLRLIITLMQTVGRFDNDLMPLVLNKGALFTTGIEQNIELFVNNEKIQFWFRHCYIKSFLGKSPSQEINKIYLSVIK